MRRLSWVGHFILWMGWCFVSPGTGAAALATEPWAGDVGRSLLLAQAPLQKSLELHDASEAQSVQRLDEIKISGARQVELLRPGIERYFQGFMGKPVSSEVIESFKDWLNESAKQQGFMAYAQTEVQGHQLLIDLVVPRVNSVRVFANESSLTELYVRDLSQRFENAFKPGTLVDVLALENKLDEVSFYFPLEMEVTIRPVGPELLDLLVNVAMLPQRTGEVLGGVVQVNNYGLRQYGRAQALLQMNVGGHVPSAKMALTAQKSEGINYGRLDYDMPVGFLQSRLHAGMGGSQSQGVTGGQSVTRAQSTDALLGLERVLGYRGDAVIKSALDISQRHTRSNLASSGVEINRLQDRQLRWRLGIDNDRLSLEPMRLELGLTAGNYVELVNMPNIQSGAYSRLEFNGRKQLNLTADGALNGLLRLKAIANSRPVESANQISLGGMGGVRAYTSVDGMGDDGVVGSLELNYRSLPTRSLGIFYDGGVVRPSKTAITGIYPHAYSLQAVGGQINGSMGPWYYAAVLAKGIGGNRSAQSTDTESSPNNWRMHVSLTYAF